MVCQYLLILTARIKVQIVMAMTYFCLIQALGTNFVQKNQMEYMDYTMGVGVMTMRSKMLILMIVQRVIGKVCINKCWLLAFFLILEFLFKLMYDRFIRGYYERDKKY